MSTDGNSLRDSGLPGQRFRAFDGLYLRMGQSQQLAYCPLTDEAKVLGNAVARILQGCRSAATLDEHAASACRQLGLAPAQAPAVRTQLAELATSGLLVSDTVLIQRCREGSVANAAAPPISSLGIFTHQQPSRLRRSLEGFAESRRKLGRAMRFVIADSSDDLQARQDSERVLATVSAGFGGEITYIGAEEKAAYADLLSRRAHVAPDIVRFAMLNDERCPITTGGNRNALLFATTGELTLQVDAAADCVVAPGPAMREGMTLTSAPDPTQLWFAAEAPADAGPDRPAAMDFFAPHERLLGKSMAACLEGVGDADIDTDRMAMSFLRRLRDGGGKVHVTAVGLTGDLGMGSPLDLLGVGGATHDQLVRSADEYRRTVHSQQGIRAVDNVTIGDGTYCNGSNLGLDNRELLPPFMPAQGNEDAIFARVVRATGVGYLGHLPWTLLDGRPRQRTGEPRASASVSSGSIIEALVSSFRHSESAGVESNLANLGSLLVELGTLPPRDFEEMLARMAWTRAVQRINRLEQLLARYGHKPEFWADDVAAHLSALREALPQEHYGLPSDLSDAFGSEAAAVLMQRLVVKFGQLLEAWLHLRRTALELRGQGHEIGRRI